MNLLWQDILFVFILVSITSIVHFFHFKKINYAMLRYYLPYIGYSHFFVFWALSVMASLGLLLSFRLLPFVGMFFSMFTWGALTLSVQLYYSVMKKLPTPADLHSLTICSLDVTKGMVLPLLKPKKVSSALLLAMFIYGLSWGLTLVSGYQFSLLHRAVSSPIRISLFVFSATLFFAYTKKPLGHQFAVDAMGFSLNILRDYFEERKFSKIPRNVYELTAQNLQIPPNNVLLILDESIRADYLSVNNPLLDTTPVLENYFQSNPDSFFNYGPAVSSGTYSFLPRNVILTGVSELPDAKKDSQTNPTLFDIAKGNQYHTIFLNLWGTDIPDFVLRPKDLEAIDELFMGYDKFSDDILIADFKAGEYVRERFSKERGLFIFMMPRGVHSPYEEQYSAAPEHQYYLPKLQKGEWHTLQKRRQHVNSYKNALRYHVDGMFSSLLGEQPQLLLDSTILWTSDHGQSLMEDGQLESHGSKYLEQAIVPFLVFSTDSWVKENIRCPSNSLGTLSHMNIYPTLQSLLEHRLDVKRGAYLSLFSTGAWSPQELQYIGGGSLWKENPQKPRQQNGKLLLRPDKYLY